MRIHTNLDFLQMLDVRTDSGAPIGYEDITEHGSRTHAWAFDVRLTGSGGRNNTGLYGAGDYDGATWDEWGAFFGALYAADPTARCGGSAKSPVYADATHFHFMTNERFELNDAGTHMPADTHPRHNWKDDGGTWVCSKCDASRPGYRDAQTFLTYHQTGA